LRLSTYQFQYDEQDIIYDKWPFSAIPVCGNTKQDGSNRPKHQYQGDAPGDIRRRLAKRGCQIADRQRDGKEVKGVPRLARTMSAHASIPES
jgi:hypothetical protein